MKENNKEYIYFIQSSPLHKKNMNIAQALKSDFKVIFVCFSCIPGNINITFFSPVLRASVEEFHHIPVEPDLLAPKQTHRNQLRAMFLFTVDS